MAAPTFVAEYEAAWNNTTTPKTVSATAAAGDVFIVAGGSENANTLVQTPTGGTSITWTQQEAQSGGTGNQSHCILFSAAPSAQSWTLSVARSATANWWGFNALRFSGSSGIGAHISTNNGTSSGLPTVNLTTTGANSAIVAIVANWNGGTAEPTWGAINGYTPTVANGGTVSFFGNTANYAISVAIYPDVGAAGSKTISQSAPTGQRYVIAAIEVLGSAGGSSSASPADPVGITDNVAAPADRPRSQGDPLGLTDSAQVATAFDRSTADPVGLTDSLQIVSGSSVAPNDPLGITDAAAVVAALDRTQADPIGVTDSAQAVVAAVRTTADPVGLTDSLAVTAGASAAPADPLGITDALALSRSITIADAVGITDAVGTVADEVAAPADAVGVTDNVTVALSIARTIGDQVGISDNASAGLTAPGSADLADPLGVTDLLATTAQILRSAADSLGITDSLTVGLSRAASPSDPVGISDSVTAQTGAAPTPADGVGVSDSAVAVLSRVVTIADPVGVVDQASVFNPAVPPLPIDGVSLTVTTDTRNLAMTVEARDMEVST